MKTNKETISEMIDYIEIHLSDKLDLGILSDKCGYSKYHLCRIFSHITGMTLYHYILRRRLTEAARQLVFTSMPVMDVALCAGYETQQSFTTAFRSSFHHSPDVYRKKAKFYPLQLKINLDGALDNNILGNPHMIMDITTVKSGKILLVGFSKHTRLGFFVIGICHKALEKKKELISSRIHPDFTIGLNDYSQWEYDCPKNQQAFCYYAAAEVNDFIHIPHGMAVKELPSCHYLVFHFRGKQEDSMQPVAEYIYQSWFPQSGYQLDDQARYDFVRYGEHGDQEGRCEIQYWVPVIPHSA